MVPVSVKYLQGFSILRFVVLLEQPYSPKGNSDLVSDIPFRESLRVSVAEVHTHRFALTSPDLHKFPLLLRRNVTPPMVAFLGVVVADFTSSSHRCKYVSVKWLNIESRSLRSHQEP